MNAPQAAHVDDEYDPFGETLYMFRGKQESNCHLAKALREMPKDLMAIYKSKCKEHEDRRCMSPFGIGADIDAARCHQLLMTWVKQYWADAEKRIEGSKPN